MLKKTSEEGRQSLWGFPRLEITWIEDIRTGVSKMANWKAAGPDLVQGYWFKKFPGLHTRLQLHLQDCVNLGNVPE